MAAGKDYGKIAMFCPLRFSEGAIGRGAWDKCSAKVWLPSLLILEALLVVSVLYRMGTPSAAAGGGLKVTNSAIVLAGASPSWRACVARLPIAWARGCTTSPFY